jgi:4-diphosphocytidyl-2C-methyl-D-erythritol kinase
MLDYGALGAMMTGTGSAVFAVFRKGAQVDELVSRLRAAYGFCVSAENVSRLIN